MCRAIISAGTIITTITAITAAITVTGIKLNETGALQEAPVLQPVLQGAVFYHAEGFRFHLRPTREIVRARNLEQGKSLA